MKEDFTVVCFTYNNNIIKIKLLLYYKIAKFTINVAIKMILLKNLFSHESMHSIIVSKKYYKQKWSSIVLF